MNKGVCPGWSGARAAAAERPALERQEGRPAHYVMQSEEEMMGEWEGRRLKKWWRRKVGRSNGVQDRVF